LIELERRHIFHLELILITTILLSLTAHRIGLVAGWGNLGGGVAQPIMGSVLFPAFTNVFDGNSEKSWRVICIIPAAITLIWGLIVSFISDDAPMGYYKDMKRNGTMDFLDLSAHFRNGWSDVNIWILYTQYACCFGVEIIMNNVLVLYYTSEFGLTTKDAAALAGLFGLMNIIFRFLGGWASDKMNLWNGTRGRLWLQTLLLLCEGALIVFFASSASLAVSVLKMCLFSVFVQAAEGSTYGIVPYLNVAVHGSVAGLVGGGGSAGGIVFALCFRSLSYRRAFEVMGIVVMASSVLSIFIKIPGHAGLISGEDSLVVIEKRTRHNRITAVPTSEAETDNNLKQPDIDGESNQNFGEA
jgi:NNP family nitrate/nitrite transporter-like MFS transporter